MTSGKPGQRGNHGIGGRGGPKPTMAATNNCDDLDDMLDGFGGAQE